jgi:hypothetical protein
VINNERDEDACRGHVGLADCGFPSGDRCGAHRGGDSREAI